MADIISSDDNEKSLYLKQIRYLDEQLERCQLKCDELEKQNKSLVSQYNTLKIDKKDIIESLKRSEAAKEKKVEELLEQLESQQQVTEQDREALKMRHSQLMQELQDQISELNSQSMMQALKFEAQKEQLMSDMESLEEQLVNQKEEHEAAISSLKADAVVERENSLMEESQKNVEICLQERISEVLQKERTQHSKRMEQLQFLLKENQALWKEKDTLWIRDNELQFKMDRAKKNLDKVTLESLIHKKEVEQLRIKCQRLRVELNDCRITQKIRQDTEIETLRQRLTSVSQQCHQKTAEADQLGAKLQEERSRRRQLEAVMQEAVVILRHILTESGRTPKTERKMQRLLEILESSAPQGTGSALDDATEKSVGGQGPRTSGPKPARAETLNLLKDPLFLLAKYRPGDLGLVPRPRWKRKPTACGTAAAQSSSNQPPLNRKLCSQKTSSSDDRPDPAAPAAQQEDSAAEASTSADC